MGVPSLASTLDERINTRCKAGHTDGLGACRFLVLAGRAQPERFALPAIQEQGPSQSAETSGCPDQVHGCPAKGRRDDGSERSVGALTGLSLVDTPGAFFPSPIEGEGKNRSSGLNRTAVDLIRASRIFNALVQKNLDCREREAPGLRPPDNDKREASPSSAGTSSR